VRGGDDVVDPLAGQPGLGGVRRDGVPWCHGLVASQCDAAAGADVHAALDGSVERLPVRVSPPRLACRQHHAAQEDGESGSGHRDDEPDPGR
jgi:hypothetical protein